MQQVLFSIALVFLGFGVIDRRPWFLCLGFAMLTAGLFLLHSVVGR